MSAPESTNRRRSYGLRPWGRPAGLIAGMTVSALTFGPLAAFLAQGSSFLDGFGATAVVVAASDFLADNAMYLVAQFILVWWWLSFVKYRSRSAFALTGLVLAAYPIALIFGRNLAFGPAQSADVLLIIGAVIAAYAMAGVLSMLALHFVAYRRAD